MIKIKDLEIGSSYSLTLVVKSATSKTTRNGKPYLALEFYDGTDTINGNYWDWAGKKIPEANTIVDMEVTVTEWAGKKQLTVNSMTTNTTKILSDFAPVSEHNLSDVYKEAFSMLSEVKDDFLRNLSLSILEELRHAWLTVPGAKSIHHAYIGGTLVHSTSTAKIAKAIAGVVDGANVDLCVVGGMLHDLGKLYSYKLDGVVIHNTDEGMLYDHTFMGAEFVGNFAESHFDMDDIYNLHKVRLLRHIILSHHGKLEYGAAVTPKCIEAYIVNAADGIDASTEQLRAAARNVPDMMWTDKIYTMNNAQQLTPAYVDYMFNPN